MATTTLERRLRQLEDRVEIGELVMRYGLVMDDRDVDAMPQLFTPDVRIRSADGVMDARGRDAAVAMFLGRFTVLGPSNHFTHDRLVEFDADDDDRATGLVLSHAEMQRKGQPMLAAMRYRDVYRRWEGSWRFAERLLSFMYYVPTAEYLDAFGPGLDRRMRAYDRAVPADWPEQLPTWKRYYPAKE
ncbi:MAG TPA: nuclear transport factor 2 family protein [Steroidobacteraceae bacterium]|nr:nuclear transport factor 2 family protein [Steroidobacteraceae bacterium]